MKLHSISIHVAVPTKRLGDKVIKYTRSNDEISAFEKEWNWNNRMLIWGMLGIVLAPCLGVLLGFLLS